MVPGLPAFEHVTRLRPVAIVQGGGQEYDGGDWVACPQPAPYVAVQAGADPARHGELALRSGTTTLRALVDGDRCHIEVSDGRRTTRHRPRRRVRTTGPVEAVALALTGHHVTAFTRHGQEWVARAKVYLRERADTHDEAWLAALQVRGSGPIRVGPFGQLGLRDPRVVSHADGSPYTVDGRVLLTMTSAGPGFFDCAHTSVWSLDPGSLELEHRSDLYFRRPDRPGVYGDHATHLVRDSQGWLVATSTWGDFAPRGRFERERRTVGVTLARIDADVLAGRHVLDPEELRLPTDGHHSVGVWDPHLVASTGSAHAPGPAGEPEWIVGYVSARRFFDFFPVVAAGPSLDRLTLRAASTQRRSTEGTTIVRVGDPDGGSWRVLASDGRRSPAGMRAQYPVFDLDLHQLGTLEAPYPTNIPWPTLAPLPDGSQLLIGFNGRPYGGRIIGYGSHGDLVIARSRDHSLAR